MPNPRPSSRCSLVLGGTRSGKSAFAEKLAVAAGEPVRYLATAAADSSDPEFTERIARHRNRRPAGWRVLETAHTELAPLLDHPDTTLVDDLGTWLTGRLDKLGWDNPRGTVAPETDALVEAVAGASGRVILVSPEVGLSVVPATRSGRLFGDELGTLNQRLAAVCDEVYLVIAGLPQKLKGDR